MVPSISFDPVDFVASLHCYFCYPVFQESNLVKDRMLAKEASKFLSETVVPKLVSYPLTYLSIISTFNAFSLTSNCS